MFTFNFDDESQFETVKAATRPASTIEDCRHNLASQLIDQWDEFEGNGKCRWIKRNPDASIDINVFYSTKRLTLKNGKNKITIKKDDDLFEAIKEIAGKILDGALDAEIMKASAVRSEASTQVVQ